MPLPIRAHLVRHGRPLVVRDRPAATWELDPAGFDDVWALRDRLPHGATWFCSPEPKAVETAQLLTDGQVGILEGLAELRRPDAWDDAYDLTAARAFAVPAAAAAPGWESLEELRVRLRTALLPLRRTMAGEDVVLIGHGIAWTVLEADLAGQPPSVEAWRSWTMPDLRTVSLPADPHA